MQSTLTEWSFAGCTEGFGICSSKASLSIRAADFTVELVLELGGKIEVTDSGHIGRIRIDSAAEDSTFQSHSIVCHFTNERLRRWEFRLLHWLAPPKDVAFSLGVRPPTTLPCSRADLTKSFGHPIQERNRSYRPDF